MFAAVALLPGGASAQKDAPAPAPEQEAAVVARAYQQDVQRALDDCAARMKGGEYFQFLWHFWAKKHQAVLMMADELAPAVPERARRTGAELHKRSLPAIVGSPAPAAATPREQFERCEKLGGQMRANELDLATVYPGPAKALETLVAARPAWRNIARNADFTVGCMKREWNVGNRNAPEVRGICECQTSAMVENTSDEEVAQWLRDMEANRGREAEAMAKTPWMQRALPRIIACRTKT